METKSIPKGKATAKYWTKEEFESGIISLSHTRKLILVDEI